MQRLRVIPNHLKPTTPCRSFRSECTDDNVATALYGANNLADISSPVSCSGQKMKNRSIMPHIVGRSWQFSSRDVGDQPVNVLCDIAQPLPRGRDGGLRNIENRQVDETASEPSTNVDSPAPTSMMEVDGPAPACSISARDASRCGRYQLT